MMHCSAGLVTDLHYPAIVVMPGMQRWGYQALWWRVETRELNVLSTGQKTYLQPQGGYN